MKNGMKIGIITDIHNNLAALKAVLKVFERRQCEKIICTGDIIGIGPYPEETVTVMRDLNNLAGCVRGNHENFLLIGMPSIFPNDKMMDQGEYEHHKWEHAKLSEASRKFLSELPYEQFIELEGKRIYIAHYSMDDTHQYINYTPNPSANDLKRMFAGIEADIIIYGHDHTASAVKGKRWYINCGSAGCPGRDKNIARAGILNLNGEIEFEPLRVSYDVSKTIAAIDRFNYPDKENIKKYFYGA